MHTRTPSGGLPSVTLSITLIILVLTISGAMGPGARAQTTPDETPAPTAPLAAPPGVRMLGGPAAQSATAAELSAGRKRIEAIIEAVGGPQVLDRIRTLKIESQVRQNIAADRHVDYRVTTWVEFPNRFRRRATSNAGTMVTVVTPEESFVIVGDALFPLSDYDRFRLEESILHHPIALLKTRHDETFMVLIQDTDDAAASHPQRIKTWVMGKATTLVVDRASDRILGVEYEMASESAGAAQEVSVDFNEFRAVGGILFPHQATMTVDGREVSVSNITVIEFNRSFDPTLFRKPPSRVLEHDTFPRP